MEMLITPEWLRNKTKTEPDLDFDAGVPTELLQSMDMFLPPNVAGADTANEKRDLKRKHAFGLMVRQLRLRESQTIAELATDASILADELEAIEQDPHYQPRPRTVVYLAKTLNIALPKMMKLSGIATVVDTELEEEALKFAAKSDGVSTLNVEERRTLNEFVKFLNEE